MCFSISLNGLLLCNNYPIQVISWAVVALDFLIVRYFDRQGRKNSVIIYIIRHLDVNILMIIKHFTAFVFVHFFIFNHELTA